VLIWLWQIWMGHIRVLTIVMTVMVGAVVFVCCQIQSFRVVKKAKEAGAHELEKYRSYYRLFGSWMLLRNKRRVLAEYFEDHRLKNVAIYGLGRLGLCLYEELRNSTINVKYAIDRDSAHFSYLDLKVVSLESPLEPVDVIVVTPVSEYQGIVEGLRKKGSSPIVNLEDVISSL